MTDQTESDTPAPDDEGHRPFVVQVVTEQEELLTFLYGQENMTWVGHALAAADLIRNIASCYGKSEREVRRRVLAELDKPTTALSTLRRTVGGMH